MKLILCCDYGLDDAAATVDVLSHAAEDGWERVSLVAAGGNVPAAVSLKNAKKLVAALPFSLPALEIVDTRRIAQPAEYLDTIHGADGMGDLFGEKPCPVPVVSFSRWLGALFDDYVLLSLGPMTLVPRILARGNCVKFVFMGGNIAEEPNFNGYEFNHALNRAAFAECVRFPHVAVTMDTCRHPLLNIQPAALPQSSLLARIVNRSRELTFTSGEKGCYVWDDIAVKYLRHPEWFSLSSAADRDGNALTVAAYVYGKPYAEILAL